VSPHETYQLFGHIGSPYSMKVRAVLRYRQLPHTFNDDGRALARAQQGVKVPVIPVLAYPDGSLHNDSTPLLLDLERRHPGHRSILPKRESDAFLAALIEDLADEWLTKAMYFYRWFRPEYRKRTSEWIAYDLQFGGGIDSLKAYAKPFRERQAARLELVGCTEANRLTIELIAEQFLDALESHVVQTPFLFGRRPSLADFGLFGQLSQFILDLAVIDSARERAPFTMRWVQGVHDLSGWENGDWRSDEEPLPSVVSQLLTIAGDDYLPFLVANANAAAQGLERVRHESDGRVYEQAPYRYQVKCLAELRRAYAELSADARREVDPLLEQTRCLSHLRAV
jgi:glutathione S-transferase